MENNEQKKEYKAFDLPIGSVKIKGTDIYIGDIKVSKSDYHYHDFNIYIVNPNDDKGKVFMVIRGNQTTGQGHRFVSSPSKKYFNKTTEKDVWYNYNKFSADIQAEILNILEYWDQEQFNGTTPIKKSDMSKEEIDAMILSMDKGTYFDEPMDATGFEPIVKNEENEEDVLDKLVNLNDISVEDIKF